jgi:hypothetical protein
MCGIGLAKKVVNGMSIYFDEVRYMGRNGEEVLKLLDEVKNDELNF